MYKVLDVREIILVSNGSVSNGVYGGNSSFSVQSTRRTIVIAEDNNHHRKRFEFYDGYKEEFLGDMHYCGYKGDYELLVPGDKFEVKETLTWPNVNLIK